MASTGSTAAERQRRRRARSRAGLRVLPVEIDHHQVVDLLLDQRLVTEAEALDDTAVARAVGELIRKLIGSKKKRHA